MWRRSYQTRSGEARTRLANRAMIRPGIVVLVGLPLFRLTVPAAKRIGPLELDLRGMEERSKEYERVMYRSVLSCSTRDK
jgi:hypothetical protein